MPKQRFLCNIIFEGKRFKIFSNNNFYKTFLRVLDDNDLCYPTLEEYLRLDQIYNKHRLDIVCIQKKHTIFEFEPKAIVDIKNVGKRIVKIAPILLATSLLTGCSPKEAINYVKGVIDTAWEKVENILEECEDEVEKDKEQNSNPIIELMEDKGQIEIDEDGLIWIYDDNHMKMVKDNDEFREYVDNAYPTFKDVRKTLEKNENINGIYEELLREYIDELEEKNPDIDLVCFNYNLERLTVKCRTKEQIQEEAENNTLAFFNIEDCSIVVPEDITDKEHLKSTFWHEATHMIQVAQCEKDGKIIRKDCTAIISNGAEELLKEGGSNVIGIAYQEGMDKKLVNSIYDNPELLYVSVYDYYNDIVDLFYRTSDISINDMLENDVRYVINELEENGIEDAKYIIELMDIDYNSYMHSEEVTLEDNLREEIYTTYFEDLTQQKIKEGWTEKEIYEYVIDVLENGYIEELCDKSILVAETFSNQEELKEKTIQTVTDVLEANKMSTMTTEEIQGMGKETDGGSESYWEEETKKNSSNESININLLEKYVYVNCDSSEITYKIYNAIEDENGDIIVYDEEFNQVEIDTIYGAFVEELKELGILIQGEDAEYILKVDEFIKYCRRKEFAKEENLYVYKTIIDDEKYIKTCYSIKEENGNIVFYDKNTLEEINVKEKNGEYYDKLLEEGLIYRDEDGEASIDGVKFDNYISNREMEDER